jgi:toxin ParE1/3/4
MSLLVRFAPWFDADLHFRAAWYAERGGNQLAERFVSAVEATVSKLAENPQHGRRSFPKDIDLVEIHSVLVERPFHKYILYYRFTAEVLVLERLIHGARDLPRRLRESPYEAD